jgi:shikimate dehydrogenase
MIQLGLVGFPVSHSLSPQIQNAALKACGVEGSYSLFPVPPDDMQGLKELLDRIRSGEIRGLNVTIPHKQNVIQFMDDLTPTAKSIGAINILYLRGAKLIGDNTDAPGFLSDLHKFLSTGKSASHEKNALVLGAGGSARSVVYALLNDGWLVTLLARRIEQSRQLADSFANNKLVVREKITDVELSNMGLIVNATPLGMTPNISTSPLPDLISLPRHAHIYDLVYNPRETKLVHDARSQGLSAITGLGMLIEQAALGFELWTGNKLSSDVFRRAIA